MESKGSRESSGYDKALHDCFMDSHASVGGGPARAGENRFETLARMAPVGIFVTDAQGRCSYVNPRWCRLAGIQGVDAMGTGWVKAIHPEDRDRVARLWEASTGGRDSFRVECRFQRPDQGVSWVVVEASPEHNPAGETVGYVGTATDVTEIHKAEAELRERESRLGAILETAVDGIVLIDDEGTIRSFNAAAERMFGYRESEIVGANVTQLMPSPHREEHGDYIRNYLETKRGKIIGVGREVLGRRKDGGTFPIELGVSEVDGGEVRFAGIVRDISRQKAAEEALRDSRRTLSTLIGNLPGMVYRCANDHAWTMKFVSAGCEDLTGHGPEAFVEERVSFADLIHPDDRDEVRRQVERAVAARHPYTLNYRLVDVSGATKWVWEQGTPVFDGDELKFLEGWVTDVTKRKQLEEEFLQAQKLEAVGRLAGGIAHDFNTLLTAIIGGCRIVESHVPESSEAARFLGEVRREAKRGASMTRQLLDFSRKRPHEPRLIRVNDAVKDAEMILRKLLGEDVDLEVRLDGTDPRILADPVQIEQILMNLSVNARDSMPQGGKLRIGLSSTQHIEVGGKSGAFVVLEVTDSGCGMDRATRERAFEPFFTTKGVGKGTGLGLSTVFGLVQEFGGHIELESELGKGTTFRLYFPRHGNAATTTEEVEPEVEKESVAGEGTILVVEDEDLVRAGIVHFLKRLGYDVLSAGTPTQAMEVVEACPRIELILSDIVLPEKNGPTLVEEIKRRIPNVRVLFMSGFSDDALREQGRLESGVAIIEKPFEEHDLAQRIRESLREER